MAKKKARASKGTKPKAEPAERKPFVVQIRGSAEFKAWVEELAEAEGDTVAKMFERAVRKVAQERGFKPPPKR